MEEYFLGLISLNN